MLPALPAPSLTTPRCTASALCPSLYHSQRPTRRVGPRGTVLESRNRRLPNCVAVIVYTDITETKRIEAALRQSEQRYALALSGANEGIWEWGDEVDGVYASQRLREIVALQSHQASIPSYVWLARTHPDNVH